MERAGPRPSAASGGVQQPVPDLAKLLRCDPAELRPDAPLVPILEVAVEAAAGGGGGKLVEEKARWYLPEAMVRHEGDADPKKLRILRVRGDSMEPEMREGDWGLVDTARRLPATGKLFVLFDSNGLVVKRVEREPGEARLRLVSANRLRALHRTRGRGADRRQGGLGGSGGCEAASSRGRSSVSS